MAKGLFTQGMCVLLRHPVAIADLEYLTRPEAFDTVERGEPLPYTIPEPGLSEGLSAG